mmetsp:Transcript_11089/g.30320  ORF Transcript_11089/g.30320 Transcript_11089/m.30320 type:complete len:243 (+) Transcript_11089:370-1098(+)
MALPDELLGGAGELTHERLHLARRRHDPLPADPDRPHEMGSARGDAEDARHTPGRSHAGSAAVLLPAIPSEVQGAGQLRVPGVGGLVCGGLPGAGGGLCTALLLRHCSPLDGVFRLHLPHGRVSADSLPHGQRHLPALPHGSRGHRLLGNHLRRREHRRRGHQRGPGGFCDGADAAVAARPAVWRLHRAGARHAAPSADREGPHSGRARGRPALRGLQSILHAEAGENKEHAHPGGDGAVGR